MDISTYEQILRDSKKIKLEPLKQWHCDKCGEVIQNAEDGWFEWLQDLSTNKQYKFRIVHHDELCMFNEPDMYKAGFFTKDMKLNRIIGPDGLNVLLDIMMRPHIEQAEFVQIIKRIHLPFYEQSLLYRDKAKADGILAGGSDYYCNVEDNLGLINRYANEE